MFWAVEMLKYERMLSCVLFHLCKNSVLCYRTSVCRRLEAEACLARQRACGRASESEARPWEAAPAARRTARGSRGQRRARRGIAPPPRTGAAGSPPLRCDTTTCLMATPSTTSSSARFVDLPSGPLRCAPACRPYR